MHHSVMLTVAVRVMGVSGVLIHSHFLSGVNDLSEVRQRV
jgi:hypothetical protein